MIARDSFTSAEKEKFSAICEKKVGDRKAPYDALDENEKKRFKEYMVQFTKNQQAQEKRQEQDSLTKSPKIMNLYSAQTSGIEEFSRSASSDNGDHNTRKKKSKCCTLI